MTREEVAQAAGRVVSCCRLRFRVVPVDPSSMKARNARMALLPLASTCGGGSCSEVQPSVSMLVSSVSLPNLAKLLQKFSRDGSGDLALNWQRHQPRVVPQR